MINKSTLRSINSIFLYFLVLLLSHFTILAVVPTNGKIAFVSDRTGGKDIYLMNADGSQPQAIATEAGPDDFPAWSPDGSKIAFLRGTTIAVMNADGTGMTPLVGITPFMLIGFPWEHFNIDWSPDGEWIAFSDGTDIKVIRANGTDLANLTKGEFINYSPAWSPDGAKIAFERSIYEHGFYVELFTMNRDGTNVRAVTSSPPYNESRSPDWSPDGSKILIATALETFDGNGIATVSQAAPDPLFLLPSNSNPEPGAPKWSPDGQKIVFHRIAEGTQIWTMDRQGANLTQLTFGSANNFRPDWQPLTNASISGRIFAPTGQGLRNTVVTLMDDQSGTRQNVTTSSFGYYFFDNIPVNRSYTIVVTSRRYRFSPLSFQFIKALTGLDLIGGE